MLSTQGSVMATTASILPPAQMGREQHVRELAQRRVGGQQAHADGKAVPARRHVDLVVVDPHAGDRFALGRRGEHPLGVGLAACDGGRIRRPAARSARPA
jgi:hypothetical protein